MLYIFDMGGVVTTTAKLSERMSQVIGITEEEFKEKNNDLFQLLTDGEITTDKYWETFAKRSGIAITTDWWHWLFHPILNETTVKIIRAIKKDGNRVVCGTNTIPSHYFNHLERGDYAYFDQTYASCYMGTSKPNHNFWKTILEAEQVPPRDVVFIDDREENCHAAQEMGIHSIHFTTAENLANVLGVKLE